MAQSTPDDVAAAAAATSPMVTLLGPKLLTKRGTTESTDTLLKDKQLVALYFSASWCPPCKAFSPVLIDFYRQHAAKNGVEIIYLSSDHTVTDFAAYYAKMPWLALPRDDQVAMQYQSQLASKLQIQGIPTLIVLDVATGGFITRNARTEVQQAQGAAGAAVVVEVWKRTPPVPLDDIVAAAAGSNDPLSLLKRLVTHVLKNPIYIFGILYFVKQFWRTRSNTTTTAATNGDDGMGNGVEEPIPEDEF